MAMNIKTTNKDKSASTPIDTAAAPVQNFTSSIFRSVNIKFNDTSVCQISNYGVYSQLSLMLNTNNNDMATWMKNLLYEKDTSLSWDETDTNQGWIQWRNHFGMVAPESDSNNGGKFIWQKDAVFFMAELRTFLPAFSFLPNVDVVIDLELAKSDYVFMSKDKTTANCDINFQIEDFRLLVPCLTLNEKLFLDIETRLSKTPIRQIFNKTEVCIQSVPEGGQTAILDSLSVGRIPSK